MKEERRKEWVEMIYLRLSKRMDSPRKIVIDVILEAIEPYLDEIEDRIQKLERKMKNLLIEIRTPWRPTSTPA